MKTTCANCGNELKRIPSRMKGRNYCNAKCQNNYEFNNGIKDKYKIIEKAQIRRREQGWEKWNSIPTMKLGKRGYWLIYIPQEDWMYYHHYIWELHHKTKLPEGYCIHHIDENKLNNNLNNLQLMAQKEHNNHHRKKNV